MVDTRNLHLACDLMEMNNEKLEVGIWNLELTQVINVSKNFIRNISFQVKK
jgi:hypothetical protein